MTIGSCHCEAVDAAFDGAALLVGLAVEGGWSSAPAPSPLPVSLLVGRDGDDGADTSPLQRLAEGT